MQWVNEAIGTCSFTAPYSHPILAPQVVQVHAKWIPDMWWTRCWYMPNTWMKTRNMWFVVPTPWGEPLLTYIHTTLDLSLYTHHHHHEIVHRLPSYFILFHPIPCSPRLSADMSFLARDARHDLRAEGRGSMRTMDPLRSKRMPQLWQWGYWLDLKYLALSFSRGCAPKKPCSFMIINDHWLAACW